MRPYERLSRSLFEPASLDFPLDGPALVEALIDNDGLVGNKDFGGIGELIPEHKDGCATCDIRGLLVLC